MEILQNAYRIPVFSAEQTQEIVNVLNSKEFQEIYSFYAQQIPPESVLNNLPDLEKKFGFYFSYTGQDDYIPQLQSVLYKKHMPSIEEFLKKPEYMGNSWGITYPYWRQKLMEMFKPGTRVFECLSGDTEIPLMSGKTITIRDLYNSGVSDEYAYSWNEDQWKFEPGKIGKVIYNGKRKVYKVTLDNGKSFKVTGNHKILCRNNKWKTVDSLKIGDSLMPFSRYISHKSDKCELEGYECINVPNKTGEFKSEYTHRLSALWKTGMTYGAIAKKCNMKHPVIHHKNFNKLDNRPGNLIYLSGEMHHMYHSRHINEYRNANKEELREKQLAYWQSERGEKQKEILREKFRDFLRKWYSDEEYLKSHREKCRLVMQSEERIKQSSLNLKDFNDRIKNGDPEALRILRENTRKGIIARWSDPEQRKLASKKMTDLNNSGNASKAGKARWNKSNSEEEKEKLRQLMLIRNKENNPSARNDLTDNDIIDALKSSYSVTEAREKLKCSRTYITSHIEKMGIDPNNLLKPITKELLEELLRDSYTFAEAAEKFGVAARRFRVFTNKFSLDEKQYLKVNHKVVSIELLDEEEDVYDIFVDGKYHNFALDVGSIVHNCIWRGCIGSGKTTIARRAALYCIYRLCCLRNPHAMFNIAPDTAISALMISVIMTQAETTVFAPMLQMIRNTPCFKEVRKEASFEAFGPGDPVPFVKNGIRLIFPGNIFLTIGSNINHVIGQSSAIVVMDEAEEKNPQEAFDLYTAMRGRIKSRFLDSSLTMCSLISSSKSKSGMVWEYIKKIPKDDPTVMLMEPPIWDVKASVFDYNKGRFWIQVGTKTNPSVILPSEYDNVPENKLTYVPPPGCKLISVPYEYRRDFENNIEKYLQDYGGITTDTSDRPFDDLSNLGDPGLIPEVHLEASLGDSKPLIEKLPEKLFVNTTRGLMLARYPYAKRYIHIDLASRDASQTGYSLWHIEYIKDEKTGDKIPVYVADFISWITATTRIDHELVNQLALDLKYKAHVNIEAISYDQFQSEAIRQKLKQDREFPHVDYQSVDRTNEAYTLFSQLMLKGQIKVGDCPYLREQLSNIGLEDGKVLTTHKKDMADSCLSFDTKIFLLSGKIVTIEELYRMDLSKEWVLACDTETRKLVPVKIERVIEKHIPDHLLRFHLSNGRSFATTEDHLILMRNSEFVQAEDIKVGDSLMPFNYYHELNYHDRYRKVVNPYTRKAEFLYKLVSKTLLQEKINDAKNRAVLDGSKFTVIHHVNHNKNNDTPENLMPLTNIEHTNLHAMTGREIKAFHDRSVFKRERTKVINKGLNLMKRVNPEGYRRYVIEHDVETKLAERRAKEDNSEITIESIEVIPNNKPVYDIVLNSIHNFALDCNIFVHNCVGSVYNALTYGPNKNTQALLDCPYYCGEELKKTTVEVLGYTNDDYDVEEI